ncbi:MAG: hypothetical protein J7J10_05840 [Deltaproteobacteria bacterium]|nr:hypothetical protein [Deltaproteobacteria bacterium]
MAEYMRGYIDRYTGSAKAGDFSWFAQRITGLCLILILIFHMFINHWSGLWPSAMMWFLMHAMFKKAFYVLFSLFLVYHGMNGVFYILDDYIRTAGWRTTLKLVFGVTGIIYFWVAFIAIVP